MMTQRRLKDRSTVKEDDLTLDINDVIKEDVLKEDVLMRWEEYFTI